MEKFLKATIKANKKIYSKIKSNFKKSWFKEHSIGAGGDISSGIDLYAESVFIKYLSKFGEIESEESGKIGTGDKKIVIDPLDGSSNILSSFPYYGSSVALINQGIVEVAVVCNYANGDIFYKIGDKKLKYGNLEKLNFKKEKIIKSPKIGLFERSYAYEKVVKALHQKNLKYRAPGAVALSLSYAHRVNFVIYIGKVRHYDIAAGLKLCEDLKVKVSNNYVIVTKKQKLLNELENIILEGIKNEIK